MNLKKNLSLAGLALMSGMLPAHTRTAEAAHEAASAFVLQQKATLNIPSVAERPLYTLHRQGHPVLYLFNGSPRGYVIVAAEEQARPILAYSDEAQLPDGQLPDPLLEMLDDYAEQLSLLHDESVVFVDDEMTADDGDLPLSVAPLLGAIRYNQREPYNNLCPTISASSSQKSAAGCVAIAMAQIMKYYQYPQQGNGSHTYTVEKSGISCSANFGATTYDWSQIYDSYTGSESTEAQRAAATLVYHCGVSVEMNYGTSSGATSQDVVVAMNQYFGYDSGTSFMNRAYYTTLQWEKLIRTELAAGRPVYMAGKNPNGAHAFVCDGYDEQGFFHLNWGWNGKSNGYFTLDCLNGLTPLSQGDGGTDAGYGQGQKILCGLQPETGSTPTPNLCLYSYPTVDSDQAVFKVANYQAKTFAGEIGMLVYQEGEYRTAVSLGEYSIAPNYTKTITVKASKFDLFRGCTLLPALRVNADSDWQPIHAELSGFNALYIDNTGDLSEDTSTKARISLAQLECLNPLYQGYTARFNVTLRNTSDYEFNSDIYIALYDSGDKKANSDKINLILQPDEERTFEMSMLLDTQAAGACRTYLCYNGKNGKNYHMNGNYEDAANKVNHYTILESPELQPELLVNRLELLDHPTLVVYPDEPLTLRAYISNTGGFGEYETKAVVWRTGNTTSVTSQGKHRQQFAEGQNTIDYHMQLGLEPGSYYVRAYYIVDGSSKKIPDSKSSNKLSFTIAEAPSGIESAATSETVEYYGMNGNRIGALSREQLPAGTYLMRRTTSKGTETQAFVKW